MSRTLFTRSQYGHVAFPVTIFYTYGQLLKDMN